MDIPKLHDATLLDVSLQWGETATVTVRFHRHADRVVLRVSDVKLLHCPHENSWGPSVSVNEVRSLLGSAEGLHRIELEIQSGDTILVEGRVVEWAVETDTA